MVRVFLDKSSIGQYDLFEDAVFRFEDLEERELGGSESAARLEPAEKRQRPLVMLGRAVLGVVAGRPGRDEEGPVGALEQELLAEELTEKPPVEPGQARGQGGRGGLDPV